MDWKKEAKLTGLVGRLALRGKNQWGRCDSHVSGLVE